MSFDPRVLRLIAISGEPPDSDDELVNWAAAVARGGATMVQLRAKHTPARRLVELARRIVAAVPLPVIVNDRVDVAIIAGAAGVHLGSDDLPVQRVRAFAPAGFIVGASLGNDEELVTARGADYVGVGPVYDTGSKVDAGNAIGPQEMARLIRASGCPGVGIGGIEAANAADVIAAGADGVAVLSALAVLPESAARALASAIGR